MVQSSTVPLMHHKIVREIVANICKTGKQY